jgi:serine-type D-Ala-D-Ala carboxypeptidase/endopeptidase
MRIACARIVQAAVIGGLVSVPALAQAQETDDPDPLPAAKAVEIATEFATPFVEQGELMGVAIGIITADGKESFASLGSAEAGTDRKVTPDTSFEVGSITKVFTGVLLGFAVVNEETKLEQEVNSYLPASSQLGDNGRAITLSDLATHGSGLPPMPLNFMPKDPNDPYGSYGKKELLAFVGGYRPPVAPGVRRQYSNLGMGLLGFVLAHMADRTYEDLLQERILGPLGMTSSTTRIDKTDAATRARGHTAGGDVTSDWTLDALAGAGALRSTSRDMAKFARAALGCGEGGEFKERHPKLAEAIALSMALQPQIGDMPVGLGWHMDDMGRWWHNGATGGFTSMLVVDQQRCVAVVVLSNSSGPGLVERLAEAIIGAAAGHAAEAPEVRAAVKVPEDQLERVVGTYRLAPQFALTITREGEKMFIQATGQPRLRLFASSPTRFFLREVDAELEFELPEGGGKATKATLFQDGNQAAGPREGE